MGMAEPMGDSNTMYLYIIKGHLMQKVDEGTHGAVKRVWENKQDGSSGTKYELQFKNLTGHITGIDFKESDFGEQCIVKMEANGESAHLQMGLDSRYFSSFAQRFKNINLNLEVTLNAYDFEKDGKKRSGISITQDGKKVESYFWDSVTRTNINGLPLPENNGENYDKDDWIYYFSKVKKFLKAHIENEFTNISGHDEVFPSKMAKPANKLVEHSKNEPLENVDDDLPF